jgi:hypothetical protein
MELVKTLKPLELSMLSNKPVNYTKWTVSQKLLLKKLKPQIVSEKPVLVEKILKTHLEINVSIYTYHSE